MRGSTLFALLVCIGAVLVTGCGSPAARPFRIGILSDCFGSAGGFNEANVASAELPLVERGAKLLGHEPSDGVGPVTVAGRRIEVLQGCVAGTDEVIPEARRLVEEDGAEAIVGPEDPAQGMALRQYARKRPGTAFLIEPSAAPELTLIHPARNVFRFTLDAAQSTAGLGEYAYTELGWRKAVVIGDDVPYAWGEAAGFVAEFCALGGRIVDRVWVPLGVDPAVVAARIPQSAQGVYVATAILPMSRFLQRYASLGHDLSRELVSSVGLVADPAAIPLAQGVVVAGSPAVQPTPSERAYMAAWARAFATVPPEQGLTGLSLAYGIGVEATLEALERADGMGGKPLLDALARLRLDFPLGRMRVDRNRQAVGPNYLSRVASAGARTLRVVPDVEQTFGGYFGPGGPPPSETTPACVKHTLPRWAR